MTKAFLTDQRRSFSNKKLTLCSSVIPLDKFCIETNWRWVNELNDHKDWEWVIAVDNDEGPPQEKIVASPDARCHLVIVDGEDTKKASVKGANYHHAAAIEKVLKFIKTRFVVFLDPDFYIVQPNWIDKVVGYMIKNNLAFFGAPWHPRWYMKYRYFPCVHCLFIDLEQIPLSGLDFMPTTPPSERSNQLKENGSKSVSMRRQIHTCLPDFLRTGIQYALWSTFQRKAITKGPDTGVAIFEKYRKNGHINSECLIAVFRPEQDFMGPAYMLGGFNALVERFLPDQWCYLPRKKDSYTGEGFKELGYPDVSQRGWEEFMWQGEPFGFHIRRYPKRENNPDEHKGILVNTLDTVGGLIRKSIEVIASGV